MPTSSPEDPARFPDLAEFISGWFHQDFDINGDTLEEVVGVFRREVQADYAERVSLDIGRFLASEDGDLNDRFQRMFQPDIIPTAFRPTTREFLEAIRSELSTAG
ncbi:contact-dependent growth inhibition system immunity protein [Roseateles chitinivorans]|uniref:contact-dependent growth inhibition system immunity protein n=1 Tax=Roseateles chitinivorans TaxID=2917965 RepID=UPI003D66CFAD